MSSSSLVFNPIFPAWLVILGATIFTALFIWKEVQRGSRLLVWRIIAQILVVIAISGLILRPSIRSQEAPGSILLLTKGYSKIIADSLQLKYPSLQLLRTWDADDFPSPETATLAGLTSLGNKLSFVLGEGLPVDALDLFDGTYFHYFPCELPAGISELLIHSYTVNQKAAVKGEFNNGNGNTQLKLVGPAGAEDSVNLAGNGVVPFSLSFVPRHVGKFTYQLAARINNGPPAIEDLPIEILPERKLHILFLQKYPSFESRFLKNYLSEGGHAIWIRNQLSKDVYRSEFDNREPNNTRHLTSELFSSIDLLFIDSETLEGMDLTERREIENATRQGLGVIILFNKSTDIKSLPAFLAPPSTASASDTSRLTLPSAGKVSMTTLPVRLQPGSDVHAVIRSGDGRILSGYQPKGFGKIGFQFAMETYSLRLRGYSDAYAELWSSLVQQTARTKREPFKIIVKSQFPRYVNDPISVDVISQDQKPALLCDSIPVPLLEDVTVDDLWHGKIWVGRRGWHQLSIAGDSSRFNFFVSEVPEWSSLAKAHQIDLNLSHQTDLTINNPRKEFVSSEISPLWFFALFLLSSGFLWLAPKL